MIGPRAARTVRESWPAAAIWSVATTTVLVTCKAAGYAPFSPSSWTRWDSYLYLDIARHGYTLFRCAPPAGSEWCGDAGWFPAYPWLLRALATTGLPLAATALAVSWLFSAATIVLLGLTFLRGRSLSGVAALAYASFAPGMVFFYAVSPMSMLVCFLVIHIWMLSRRRWVGAGVAGAIAALAHPVGMSVIIASGVWIFTADDDRLRERLRRIAIVSGLSLAGPIAFVADQAIELHRVNAYLLVQAKYGHGVHDPLGPVVNALHLVARTSPFALSTASAIQTILVAFLLGCVLVELLVHRQAATASDWLLAVWASVTWLLPHMAGNVSLSRSEAALALLAVLARRLPRPLLALVLALAIWLTIAMTQLFLRGALV